MGILRDKVFDLQKKRNIARLSREADMYTNQLDQPDLASKIEAAGRINEISEKIIKLSNLQLRKDTRAMDQRTSEMLNQMAHAPNLYQQMRQEEMGRKR